MYQVYNDADFIAIHKQRNKVIAVFLAVTAVYFVFCVAWIIYHVTLPYADTRDLIPRICVFTASALYMLFAFPYLAIKYRRVNRYHRLFQHFGEALKMQETYHFYGFRERTTQKDHVDAISCIFAFFNKNKQEWMEREVYCDPEKELPPFERGDLVHYITQSNFILEYEILKKREIELGDVFEYEPPVYQEADDEDDEYDEEEDDGEENFDQGDES